NHSFVEMAANSTRIDWMSFAARGNCQVRPAAGPEVRKPALAAGRGIGALGIVSGANKLGSQRLRIARARGSIPLRRRFMSILKTPAHRGQCQTVRQVIKMYLAQAKRDLSARSYETVSCILRRFEKACGRLKISKCRPFDLQCWLNDHPEYRSEWYRRCVISTIKRAFNWACEMELIHRNPFAKLRSRGHPQRRRPMTDEEFQTLLRGADPTFRRFLIFLKFTGCRPGE